MSTINEKVRSAFETSSIDLKVNLRSGFDINLATSDVHSLCDMFADEDKWVQFFESTPEACYAVKVRSLKMPASSVSVTGLHDWMCPFYVIEADVTTNQWYFALMRDADRKHWNEIVTLSAKDRIYEEFDILYWISNMFQSIDVRKLYRVQEIKEAIMQFADAFKSLLLYFSKKGFIMRSHDNFFFITELPATPKNDLRRLMWRLCFRAKLIEKAVGEYEESTNITV